MWTWMCQLLKVRLADDVAEPAGATGAAAAAAAAADDASAGTASIRSQVHYVLPVVLLALAPLRCALCDGEVCAVCIHADVYNVLAWMAVNSSNTKTTRSSTRPGMRSSKRGDKLRLGSSRRTSSTRRSSRSNTT